MAITGVVPPSPPAGREDPAVVEARQLQATYTEQISALRADMSLSDLGRAKQITTLWERTSRRLAELVEAFWAPRRARLEFLQRQLPIGPGIDPDTSPADRAVLSQAWALAWSKAQAASRPERRAMLAEATRWGDELTVRAVLTAAIEARQRDLLDAYAPVDPTLGPAYREWLDLHGQLTGARGELMFMVQATRQPAKPAEASALRSLQAGADRQTRQQTRVPGVTSVQTTGRIPRGRRA